jgi:hypothetical protein
LNFIKKLISTRDEIRSMGMPRTDAEEIAHGIVDKLPRESRRSAERKIRRQRRKT